MEMEKIEEQFSILIVDDQIENLRVLQEILKPHYRTCFALSGEEAIAIAEQNAPDLILLDILMPDMDGFEVLMRLKDNATTKDIPVIIITGLSDIDDEQRGLFMGAVDYITKPFKPIIVEARVHTHLRTVSNMRTIETLCKIDSLTNIANRRDFDNRMMVEWKRAVREKTAISLLMIDVDHFKQFNDTYGHPKGDSLLRVLAGSFANNIRRGTDFPARIGGEEFAVLLPETNMKGALCVAEFLRSKAVQATINISETEKASASVSIGVATLHPQIGDDCQLLLDASDAALYQAKRDGRNCVRSTDDIKS